MALTVKSIAKKPPGRYRDTDTRGLYLQVGPTLTKSWLLRYEINGRERFMGLGSYPTFSLKEARERARKQRQLLEDGIDPLAAREGERRAREVEARKAEAIPTFAEAAKKYFDVQSPRWRSVKHSKQFTSSLETYAFPKLGKLKVNEITTDDVRLALEPIWTKIAKTASRTRGRIEMVLSWAIANRYREGPNPARWADNLEHLLAAGPVTKAKHYGALPFNELPEFMIALSKREGIAARALEFTVLTAARTGETLGANWDEIDLKERTWTVPAQRIKGGKEHRVPLSDRAVEILQSLPTEEGNPLLFIGPRNAGLSSMAMAGVLQRMGFKDGRATVHGFRSTFRDWAAERTHYPEIVVEQCLAHSIGSAVEKAYRRGDLFEKRRRLMTEWSRFCVTEPVKTSAKIVALR